MRKKGRALQSRHQHPGRLAGQPATNASRMLRPCRGCPCIMCVGPRVGSHWQARPLPMRGRRPTQRERVGAGKAVAAAPTGEHTFRPAASAATRAHGLRPLDPPSQALQDVTEEEAAGQASQGTQPGVRGRPCQHVRAADRDRRRPQPLPLSLSGTCRRRPSGGIHSPRPGQGAACKRCGDASHGRPRMESMVALSPPEKATHNTPAAKRE